MPDQYLPVEELQTIEGIGIATTSIPEPPPLDSAVGPPDCGYLKLNALMHQILPLCEEYFLEYCRVNLPVSPAITLIDWIHSDSKNWWAWRQMERAVHG